MIAALLVAGALVIVVWLASRGGEQPDLRLETAFPYGEIRVGVDPSYPPFASVVDGELVGVDVDLARALAAKIGLPVRFVPLSFDSLYDALVTDQVDALIAALRVNPARRDEVRYTRPYYDAGLQLVSGEAALSAVAGLAGQRLAFEFGSVADAEARRLQRRVGAFERRPYELPRYALDALRLGEADAALIDATSYHLYLREHPLMRPRWEPHRVRVTHVPYAVAVRLDRTGTWARLDRALQDSQRDGTLQRLLDRWL